MTMLKIKKIRSGGKSIVSMSGTIEEDDDLNELIGPVSGETVFNCKDIQRINSAGTRSWIRYFEKLSALEKDISFIELSPAMVEQANMVVNFFAGGKVESVYVPYLCKSCDQPTTKLFPVDEIKQSKGKLPVPSCKSCEKPMVFDDVEEDYFEFLIGAE